MDRPRRGPRRRLPPRLPAAAAPVAVEAGEEAAHGSGLGGVRAGGGFNFGSREFEGDLPSMLGFGFVGNLTVAAETSPGRGG